MCIPSINGNTTQAGLRNFSLRRVNHQPKPHTTNPNQNKQTTQPKLKQPNKVHETDNPNWFLVSQSQAVWLIRGSGFLDGCVGLGDMTVPPNKTSRFGVVHRGTISEPSQSTKPNPVNRTQTQTRNPVDSNPNPIRVIRVINNPPNPN